MRLWALAISRQPRPGGPSGARTMALYAASFIALILGFTGLAGCGNGTAVVAAPQSTVPTASALGPQLGYLWLASSQTLRPILGIPGASQVGQSIVPEGAYVDAATNPIASLAVLQAADGSFEIMALPSGHAISLSLTLPLGAKLRLSPSGTAALAYTSGAASATLITGLPALPKVKTVAAPSAIADAAVSDAGTIAFESSGGLFVLANDANLTTLARAAAPGGISFLPGTASSHDDLLYADSAANTLTLVRSSTSGPSSQTIPTSGLLQSPSAVGVSASGRWALVANSGSHTTVRIDLTTLTAASVACTCQPTLAEPLADDGAFRITALASGPNFLIKAALPTPVTLFIPALPAPSNSVALASTARP